MRLDDQGRKQWNAMKLKEEVVNRRNQAKATVQSQLQGQGLQGAEAPQTGYRGYS